MPIDEYAFFQNKLSGMLKSLDDAKHQSADPPDAPALVVASKIYSGQPGRPRLEIDQNFLQHALQHRGPSGLAEIFNCSRRTIRRRALEYGLVVPGEPVYHEIQTDTGTERVFTSTTGSVASLTDSDLDAKIAEILCTFPSFGHRMLKGRLRAMGYNVPAARIASSYICCSTPNRPIGGLCQHSKWRDSMTKTTAPVVSMAQGVMNSASHRKHGAGT